jgi:hypothetical protein
MPIEMELWIRYEIIPITNLKEKGYAAAENKLIML